MLVIGPVMLAALTMLFIDRHYGGVFFNAGEGGAPLLYEHLAWFFFTGVYMMVVVFASGVISDVLPTFARKPLFSHRAAMLCMLAIAVLGPLAWMQNMYTAPIGFSFETFAMVFALALTVPVGLLIFNWIATLWDGTLHTRAAPLFAIGAISAMSVGLALELAFSVIAVGWQLDNTTAAQAATTAVFVGGMVLGGFAALHYWFPKLTGRMMGEGLGKASLGLDHCSASTSTCSWRSSPGSRASRSTSTSSSATPAWTASTWSPRSRPSCSRSASCSSSATPPTASATAFAWDTTRGAARRSSGSRSRRRRSTTSTRSRTSAAPSRSTTFGGRSANGPRAGARPPPPGSPVAASFRARGG